MFPSMSYMRGGAIHLDHAELAKKFRLIVLQQRWRLIMADIDMTTPEGRRQWTQQCAGYFEEHMADYKPTDPVDAVCHDASKKAWQWAKDAGLHPHISEDGEYEYKVQQGLRSAHWGREDSAATLILMHPVLYGLRDIKRLLGVVIVLLVVIAWRVWS